MTRTGRPRTFNRDDAVATAMLLFWEHGFESTSLAQLRAVMGGYPRQVSTRRSNPKKCCSAKQ